jgi:hypothetical protein
MVLLLDFNAEGREDIFKLTIGKESSHEISTNHWVRVVIYATSSNTIVKTHKYT